MTTFQGQQVTRIGFLIEFADGQTIALVPNQLLAEPELMVTATYDDPAPLFGHRLVTSFMGSAEHTIEASVRCRGYVMTVRDPMPSDAPAVEGRPQLPAAPRKDPV